MYFGLTLTFCFDYYRHTILKHERTTLATAFTIALIIGGIIEIMQANMNLGRSGDMIDFGADIIGAIAGMVIGRRIFKKYFDH